MPSFERRIEPGKDDIRPFGDRPEEVEVTKANMLQLDWATRAVDQAKEPLSGSKRDQAIQTMIDVRGEWFRDAILNDEDLRKEFLENYPTHKGHILNLLDQMWQEERGALH